MMSPKTPLVYTYIYICIRIKVDKKPLAATWHYNYVYHSYENLSIYTLKRDDLSWNFQACRALTLS